MTADDRDTLAKPDRRRSAFRERFDRKMDRLRARLR
jgi:hypothetical protein